MSISVLALEKGSFPTIIDVPVEPKTDTINCLMDVNICWDGSTVARDPANGCAFRECPAQEIQSIQSTAMVIKTESPMQISTEEPKTFAEKLKAMFAPKPKVATESTSPVTVQSQNIVSANVGIEGTTIQVIGTAQKDVPKIESALMNLNETNKATLSEYYKIHAKKKVNSDVVFLKAFKHNQGAWFKYSTSRYYYIENNALKEATSWQFLGAKK